MNNNNLILLQDKTSFKTNIFTISDDSKFIPFFINKDNTNLLFFDKELPYFDGIEHKYYFKEISQESWNKLVKLLDLSQYEQIIKGHLIYYKKDNKHYIEHCLKTDRFWINYTLFWVFFSSEFVDDYLLFRKITKEILEEVYKCKVSMTIQKWY